MRAHDTRTTPRLRAAREPAGLPGPAAVLCVRTLAPDTLARILRCVLAGSALLLLGSLARAAQVERVEAVGFTVADMDRSLAFFTEVLDFRPVSDAEAAGTEVEHWKGVFGARVRVVRLGLGEETLELTQYLAPRGRPFPADTRSNDHWFQHIAIVVSDMDRAYARLREHHVEHASTGPQELPPYLAAAGIRAFYFRDPDGHFLEVLQFPPDKGAARWHRPTEDLFLGIDHTAIVVSDTERSLALYRDRLGLAVAGESVNHGPEQERLNNVFGARLRITTLRASAGPGIEFLEYLAPRGGRPADPAWAANDLVHWETTLVVRDAQGTAAELERARVPLRTAGVVDLSATPLARGRAFLAEDPDRHVLQFVSLPGESASREAAPSPEADS